MDTTAASPRPNGLLRATPDGCTVRAARRRAGQATHETLNEGPLLPITAGVEEETLIPMICPSGLAPMQEKADAVVIAPRRSQPEQTELIETKPGETILLIEDEDELAAELPHTSIFWTKAARAFVEHRSPKAGATLTENLDWLGHLTRQWPAMLTGRVVACNKSDGNGPNSRLRAARIMGWVVLNDTPYWREMESAEAARHLSAVLNANCLQTAWKESKTAALHFDKNPLRHVPIPQCNEQDETHRGLAEAGRSGNRKASTPCGARSTS